MTLPLETMHKRYLQQADWTADLRKDLFEHANFNEAKRVLEVGSGTGAVIGTLPIAKGRISHGLDIHFLSLKYSHKQNSDAEHTGGDAHSLPYADNSFDFVFCHFVLLWLDDPLTALSEMSRVTRSDGFVISFAEPDYGGRIDHPPELKPLGKWQADALEAQGADSEMGRKVLGLFQQSGLKEVQSGVLGAQWSEANADDSEREWQILKTDLEGRISAEQLEIFAREEKRATKSGNRVLYVPTFFALGRPK